MMKSTKYSLALLCLFAGMTILVVNEATAYHMPLVVEFESYRNDRSYPGDHCISEGAPASKTVLVAKFPMITLFKNSDSRLVIWHKDIGCFGPIAMGENLQLSEIYSDYYGKIVGILSFETDEHEGGIVFAENLVSIGRYEKPAGNE